jgi:hypothetical protein
MKRSKSCIICAISFAYLLILLLCFRNGGSKDAAHDSWKLSLRHCLVASTRQDGFRSFEKRNNAITKISPLQAHIKKHINILLSNSSVNITPV